MEHSVDIGVILGVFATMLGGFYAVAKIMLTQASKDREADRAERDADREERKLLATAIEKMAQSSDRVAEATKRSADEAKERNGHLAEITVQQGDRIEGLIKNQHVTHQVVDEQVVNEQVVENHEKEYNKR